MVEGSSIAIGSESGNFETVEGHVILEIWVMSFGG